MGKPAWIGVMILGFVLFWPVGLAILAYLIWSGRMGCWREGGRGRWYHGHEQGHHEGDSITEHFREHWRRHRRGFRPSGNRAFDEYREGVLQRLETEQQEFQDFLEQLRHARDKAEFDQFMADRRSRPAPPDGQVPAQPD